MLLWFLAALSLIAGGIVLQARVDIKLTQLHASKARAEAAADGAIQLALTELQTLRGSEAMQAESGYSTAYRVGEYPVNVRFQPLAGLVDLNKASPDLLTLLFSTVAELGDNGARELADHVVEWRSSKAGNLEPADDAEERAELLRHGRFEAVEDLLFVPGVDRQIFDAVRDVVYVSQGGQDGVDWASAPARVLQALGGISEEEAADIAALREQGDTRLGAAPVELDLAFQERSETANYRVDATVKIGDELYLRRRWVNSRRSGRDGLPWVFFRTEPVRSIAGGDAVGAGFGREDVHAGR